MEGLQSIGLPRLVSFLSGLLASKEPGWVMKLLTLRRADRDILTFSHSSLQDRNKQEYVNIYTGPGKDKKHLKCDSFHIIVGGEGEVFTLT